MVDSGSADTVLRLTAQIVAAHVEHNAVQAESLPGLIEKVYQTLRDVGQAPVEPAKPVPAVPVKQSVKTDFIICLEDGKKLKMLKRHLMTAYKMTPAQYRVRWGLPADYPMVAPSYAKVRSSLAKKIGLGRKPGHHRPGRRPSGGARRRRRAAGGLAPAKQSSASQTGIDLAGQTIKVQRLVEHAARQCADPRDEAVDPVMKITGTSGTRALTVIARRARPAGRPA